MEYVLSYSLGVQMVQTRGSSTIATTKGHAKYFNGAIIIGRKITPLPVRSFLLFLIFVNYIVKTWQTKGHPGISKSGFYKKSKHATFSTCSRPINRSFQF